MNPFEKDWQAQVDVSVKVTGSSNENKPQKSYRDITVVFDRSGSMSNLREAVVESFNKEFSKMREAPGDTKWTIVQFDDPFSAKGAEEAFPKVVFEEKSEKELPKMSTADFDPRGSTALVDAVCLTMKQIDARVSGREDVAKPVMMIVTDGLENASTEFTSQKMREMIAARKTRGWDFMFLAANQDAWSEGGKYGMASYVNHNYTYAGASILSGAVASGGLCSFSFSATPDGIRTSIASGMIGCYHLASGSFTV